MFVSCIWCVMRSGFIIFMHRIEYLSSWQHWVKKIFYIRNRNCQHWHPNTFSFPPFLIWSKSEFSTSRLLSWQHWQKFNFNYRKLFFWFWKKQSSIAFAKQTLFSLVFLQKKKKKIYVKSIFVDWKR